MSEDSGIVFNIQKYSVHDGPGIRTVVFLKGCPMRCKWCSNPESQQSYPELAYNPNKCIGTDTCPLCADICPSGALIQDSDKLIEIDRQICKRCFSCAEACTSIAVNIYGKTMTASEIISKVEDDSLFYSRSGGGITISGGEPMSQPDFAITTLKEAKRRRINTAMETCGYCEWPDLEAACNTLNCLLFDIKSLNSHKHKDFTGVTNEKIIDNFKKVCKLFPQLRVYVRTPVIPGFNDTKEDIGAILDLLQGKNVKYELLPYHRLGQPKYAYLGRQYTFSANDMKANDETMKTLNSLTAFHFHK